MMFLKVAAGICLASAFAIPASESVLYYLKSAFEERPVAIHETGGHTLKRALGPINLITIGIGGIIGAGIFVLTGARAGGRDGH